jgi:Fur family ferric uptake transcriptional regulator
MKQNNQSRAKDILTRYLELNKYRKTPERYTILEAVYNTTGHFTLDELSDKLTSEYNFPVSRATLYNTLRLFIELRLVVRHRLQQTTKYEASTDSNSHCHQVCTMCGKVTEVKSQQIIQAVETLHTKRFRKDGFSLYIYGTCSSCQAKMTRLSRELNKQKKEKQLNKDKK